MNKINLSQAARFTSPNPVTVVCTQKPDGSTNLATVSWWTYLSFNPNMIAYALLTRWRARTALPFARPTSRSRERRVGLLGREHVAAITTYRRKK